MFCISLTYSKCFLSKISNTESYKLMSSNFSLPVHMRCQLSPRLKFVVTNFTFHGRYTMTFKHMIFPLSHSRARFSAEVAKTVLLFLIIPNMFIRMTVSIVCSFFEEMGKFFTAPFAFKFIIQMFFDVNANFFPRTGLKWTTNFAHVGFMRLFFYWQPSGLHFIWYHCSNFILISVVS